MPFIPKVAVLPSTFIGDSANPFTPWLGTLIAPIHVPFS